MRLLEAWCSGLTCSPVKAEIAGSNPVASASATHRLAPRQVVGVSHFQPLRVVELEERRKLGTRFDLRHLAPLDYPQASGQLAGYRLDLLKRGAQVLGDLGGNDVRLGQVFRGFQTLVLQPEDVEVGLITRH